MDENPYEPPSVSMETEAERAPLFGMDGYISAAFLLALAIGATVGCVSLALSRETLPTLATAGAALVFSFTGCWMWCNSGRSRTSVR